MISAYTPIAVTDFFSTMCRSEIDKKKNISLSLLNFRILQNFDRSFLPDFDNHSLWDWKHLKEGLRYISNFLFYFSISMKYLVCIKRI